MGILKNPKKTKEYEEAEKTRENPTKCKKNLIESNDILTDLKELKRTQENLAKNQRDWR